MAIPIPVSLTWLRLISRYGVRLVLPEEHLTDALISAPVPSLLGLRGSGQVDSLATGGLR